MLKEAIEGGYRGVRGKITAMKTKCETGIDTMESLVFAPRSQVGAEHGMNFDDMPELRWTCARPLVLSVLLLACALSYWLLKRNRWL